MKRMTAMLSAVAVVILAAGLLAQAKPSFAGKWTMDAPAGGAAPTAAPGPGGGGGFGGGGGGRGGFGMECTITQDATSLTVEYTQGQNPVKLSYKLDGSESKNMMMGRGGQTEQVSKASWEGNTIKIVTTTPNGDSTRVIALEAGKMVINNTAMGRDGAPATTKVSYSKGM
ncbi:MAG: hypothetical protein ABI634_09940 [Acidobacteriota bacterium]